MRTQTKEVVVGHTIEGTIVGSEVRRDTYPIFTTEGYAKLIPGLVKRLITCVDEDGNDFSLVVTEYFIQELMGKTTGRKFKMEIELLD